MKFASRLLVLSICTLCLFNSCVKTTEKPVFNEFTLNSKDGMVRSGAVYIPKGISSDEMIPVIYMGDGLVFRETGFKSMMDSMIENHTIRPVIIACSYENKNQISGYSIAYRNAEYAELIARNDNTLATLFDNHHSFFVNEFIPYIEKIAPVSKNPEDRIYFGTSNSADFGITLSLRNPGLMAEYWCFSPVCSDISDYGIISAPTSYSICWGVKEEIGNDNYFPNLMKDIRKRGGDVKSWVFNGGHDREWWKYWFSEELKRRFPYKN